MRWNARIRKWKSYAPRSETFAMSLDGITHKSRVNVFSPFFPRTTKLTALPGEETNQKPTDSMPKKSTSKTPRAPAVDREAPGSAWLYEAGHCLRMDRLSFGDSAVILPEVICIIKAADEYEA